MSTVIDFRLLPPNIKIVLKLIDVNRVTFVFAVEKPRESFGKKNNKMTRIQMARGWLRYKNGVERILGWRTLYLLILFFQSYWKHPVGLGGDVSCRGFAASCSRNIMIPVNLIIIIVITTTRPVDTPTKMIYTRAGEGPVQILPKTRQVSRTASEMKPGRRRGGFGGFWTEIVHGKVKGGRNGNKSFPGTCLPLPGVNHVYNSSVLLRALCRVLGRRKQAPSGR